MNPEEKKDLYCNYKWLHKLNKLGETLVTEKNIKVELILLSRHEAFRKEVRTSKTKFKKISAEHLNVDKDYCLNLCEMRIDNDIRGCHSTNYHVMFINSQMEVQDVLKYVNLMLIDILHYYYPVLQDDDKKNTHNKDMRDNLLAIWYLDLTLALDSVYMENYYNNSDITEKTENSVDEQQNESNRVYANEDQYSSKYWQKGCDDA